MSMKKPYIIGLKFGTWQSELWFSAEDDSETEKKWKKAVDSLTAVGIGCTHLEKLVFYVHRHNVVFADAVIRARTHSVHLYILFSQCLAEQSLRQSKRFSRFQNMTSV